MLAGSMTQACTHPPELQDYLVSELEYVLDGVPLGVDTTSIRSSPTRRAWHRPTDGDYLEPSSGELSWALTNSNDRSRSHLRRRSRHDLFTAIAC
jgi:hypothetical protein